MSVRGRYAPSPTGDLHLGNASTALLAWLAVRARGGTHVLRMEDLDRPRVRPGSAEGILRDLAWLGLDWDEGPDRGGPCAPYVQSARSARYAAALDRLRRDGRVYRCFCSRRDVAAAASAPQVPGDEIRYPGTCRAVAAAESDARAAAGERHAWRLKVDAEHAPEFVDGVRGRQGGPGTEPPGDFVVLRSDGTAAYQLAVVVDDADMAIDEVVRGDDLLASTARQLLLYRDLGLAPPRFAHVPLLLGPDGSRLSKRHDGVTIAELRAAGRSARRVIGRIAGLLGLAGGATDVDARDLVADFTLERVPRADRGIVALG